jgi:hypothetical protein
VEVAVFQGLKIICRHLYWPTSQDIDDILVVDP